ncbi:MAG: ribonuclease P protein component 2 [Candidatus Aenigmarchaeota archaeon]|nr:ribonuclease P protein component 2 [Candidatus Aenigmarchaeota archaeon]
MVLKRLPPEIRIRERYIVFSIMPKERFSLEDVVKTIWSSLLQLFGEAGTSQFHVWIPSNLYNDKQGIGIIRCSHDHVQDVRAALALVKKIEDTPVLIRTLGVTGTIKAAKEKFLEKKTLEDFSK